MMGIVNMMVRHRCACGGNFELIVSFDVLVSCGSVLASGGSGGIKTPKRLT